ncbi:hypothetical protein BS17DRAFT_762998 [Gyrodon lividus]|nr:hypothetical protein BS17DRAFT_762998 [Gyrodon lividus]
MVDHVSQVNLVIQAGLAGHSSSVAAVEGVFAAQTARLTGDQEKQQLPNPPIKLLSTFAIQHKSLEHINYPANKHGPSAFLNLADSCIPIVVTAQCYNYHTTTIQLWRKDNEGKIIILHSQLSSVSVMVLFSIVSPVTPARFSFLDWTPPTVPSAQNLKLQVLWIKNASHNSLSVNAAAVYILFFALLSVDLVKVNVFLVEPQPQPADSRSATAAVQSILERCDTYSKDANSAESVWEQLALKVRGLYNSTPNIPKLSDAILDVMFDWHTITYCSVVGGVTVHTINTQTYVASATMESLYGKLKVNRMLSDKDATAKTLKMFLYMPPDEADDDIQIVD